MSRFIYCSRKLIPYYSIGRATSSLTTVVGVVTLKQQHRLLSTNTVHKPAFDSNIIRILRNQINYHSDYAPPLQNAGNRVHMFCFTSFTRCPADNGFLFYKSTEFNSFTVEDRPGEQWITMKGKYGEDETIKIEVTMFDGSAMVPKSGNDISAENMSLHISLLVDISKGEGSDLEFVCSAWSDHIEIQKVYIFNRDKSLYQPYMGPSFRNLDAKLQNALAEFLNERGVNDDLCVFLHEFMLNKDRAELIKWLRKVKSFVEK